MYILKYFRSPCIYKMSGAAVDKKEKVFVQI